jgi:hypothetical protein
LSQRTYIAASIEKYEMHGILPRTLPMAPGAVFTKDQQVLISDHPFSSLVGALLFISSCTRPDITYSVNIMSKFLAKPADVHWRAAKEILSYLNGTKDMGIRLGKSGMDLLEGFADSDWASNIDDRTSISGGFIRWGTSPIHWYSRKQRMICTSTAETETHAMVEASKSITHIAAMVEEVSKFFHKESAVKIPTVYSDNQPAIDAMLNGKGRTKHYDIRVKYLNQLLKENMIRILKIGTEDNIADMMTKALRSSKFNKFRQQALGNSIDITDNTDDTNNGIFANCGIANMNIRRYKFSQREFEGRCGNKELRR